MGASGSGKRDFQKLKSYIVLDYLMKQSDEEHTVSANQITPKHIRLPFHHPNILIASRSADGASP